MSYKKNFKVNTSGILSPISGANTSRTGSSQVVNATGYRNYSSNLTDVYVGHPNRIERYNQYETMDLDSEINAALDIIAEFSTQEDNSTETAFELKFHEKATQTEIEILKKQLKNWYNLQEFDKRITKLFRNTIKYGDQIFIRDPETFELYWVDMANVTRIIVNEGQGKEIEQYFIRDLAPNFQNLTATETKGNQQYAQMPQVGGSGGTGGRYNLPSQPYTSASRFNTEQGETAVEAEHIVHFSLTEGLDPNWPFGVSVLETIFKVYKQKELLEEAILIYRIQRAPERRVFYIDTGDAPPHLAMQFVERIKNEIHQRRIPTQQGNGLNVMDTTYSPLSINEDFFFPQTCLSLDTSIKLLDGRDLTLKEIIQEYEQGKENYTYSVDQSTHKIEPGKIVWAGVTRKNTQVVKVTLDSGESVVCTPDHRFIMRDGSEVQAKDLKPNDSIMPLYLMDAKTGKHQGADNYLKYICPSDGKKRWVHTMVCPKSKPGKELVIHHIDCDSRNNNPTNLIEMDAKEHIELHKRLGSYHLINAWNDEEKRQKLVDGIRNYHANASESDKKMFKERGKINGANTWKNKESAKRVLKSLSLNREKMIKNKTINISDEMCSRIVELFNEGYDSISKIIRKLREDDIFQAEYKKANKNIIRDKNRPDIMLPTDRSLNKICKQMGYQSWGDFKQSYSYNHKILTVEWLDETIDTGDITIESKNDCHNFALSAGIFVHNSDGRGSKVDVLQGGQNLGEIDDLKFFNNKLLRGLRVPSSYLPTGPEDGTQSYTDGRATTAMIQEKRFNEYCKHLQKLVCSTLDREFKMFLSWRGFNIDSSMFELKLAEPLNFAAYREIELDGSRVGNFGAVEGSNLLSRRFILKKYLGLTDVEIAENEKMRLEEMGDSDEGDPEGSDLRNVGISGGDISGDLDAFDDAEFGEFGDEDMAGFDDEMGAGATPGGAAAGGPGGETMTPGTGPTP